MLIRTFNSSSTKCNPSLKLCWSLLGKIRLCHLKKSWHLQQAHPWKGLTRAYLLQVVAIIHFSLPNTSHKSFWLSKMDQIVKTKRLIDYQKYKSCPQAAWIFQDIINQQTDLIIWYCPTCNLCYPISNHLGTFDFQSFNSSI